jgi:hypothetical protein
MNSETQIAILADALQRVLWEVAKRDGEGNTIPAAALQPARTALMKCGMEWADEDIRALGLDGTTPLAYGAR